MTAWVLFMASLVIAVIGWMCHDAEREMSDRDPPA